MQEPSKANEAVINEDLQMVQLGPAGRVRRADFRAFPGAGYHQQQAGGRSAPFSERRYDAYVGFDSGYQRPFPYHLHKQKGRGAVRLQHAYAGLQRDITGQIRTREALRESEIRLKSISGNLPSAMIYQIVAREDGERKFTYLSDSVRQLYGISPEEGMADPSLIHGRIHHRKQGC